jgi:hypothetical protein
MNKMIEILSWFTGRRIWVLLAAKMSEKRGDYKSAREFRKYAERLK